MLELGGTGILLQGGLHPDLRVEYYENLLRSLKQRFRQVHLHCFSAPEIGCIAEVSGPVSYTHLDVYKRQPPLGSIVSSLFPKRGPGVHRLSTYDRCSLCRF